jgi:hypothetical protein
LQEAIAREVLEVTEVMEVMEVNCLGAITMPLQVQDQFLEEEVLVLIMPMAELALEVKSIFIGKITSIFAKYIKTKL